MKNYFSTTFEPDLQKEISNLVELDLDKDEVILKEESYIKHIPLVTFGRIKVRKIDESGKEIVLYHIEPGESCILSITSCLNDNQSKAEAITEEKTKIVVVPSSKVKEWMDEYKSWRTFVMKLFNSRLQELLLLVDSISFKQTDSRLYEKLKELQQKQGDVINITHQELANEIGTAREVISRLLKQLERDKILAIGRGSITILLPL